MITIRRIKNFMKQFVPYSILAMLYYRLNPKVNKIRNYFLGLDRDEQNIEFIEIIDYLNKNYFSMFPYPFTASYYLNKVESFYDASCKMCFVLHEGKKMYFPDSWSIEKASCYYNKLCREQDVASPHRYETKEYVPNEGDIIADIGAAEGIWALTYVEKVSKIYLFECNKEWIKALQMTFEPYSEKVIIVNKYISDISAGNKISLNEYFNDKEINFIKADIEGAEIELLRGGQQILLRDRLSLLLCTYHKQDDANILKQMLESNGFITEYSNGYMFFIYDKEMKKPYIRHGLIRAKRKES